MGERAALFAAVLSDPADNTARLVLADWLDEHGEPLSARFLRAGVTASRFRDEPLIDDPAYYRALADLSAVAEAGAPAAWLAALGVGPVPLTSYDWVWDNDGDRVTVRIGRVSGVCARGMLSELILPLAEWYEFAPRAFAGWPLEGGTVTDVPGLRFAVGPRTRRSRSGDSPRRSPCGPGSGRRSGRPCSSGRRSRRSPTGPPSRGE